MHVLCYITCSILKMLIDSMSLQVRREQIDCPNIRITNILVSTVS